MKQDPKIERKFDLRMNNLPDEIKKVLSYRPSILISKLNEYGPQEETKRIINQAAETETFKNLRECGRLDLSVEAIILDPKWESLFYPTLRKKAKARLERNGFDVDRYISELQD
jgi:hypothetical protein